MGKVTSDASNNRPAYNSGNTALHLAAEKGLVAMAELLVAHGAALDARNAPSGWTPLHFAAYEGHTELVRLLVEAGAAPDAEDAHGDTPEAWALEWENYKVWW